MVDVEFGQEPLPIAHWNTFTPTPSAVTGELGELGEVIVPAPEISDHVPVPTAGVFAAKTVFVAQIV